MPRLTLDLPDELSTFLAISGHNLERAALEAIALEAYRERKLTTAQLRRLLGFESRYELDGFLKQHEVWLDYTWQDLEQDRETAQATWPLSMPRIVISDTSPLRYLILLGQPDLLPALYSEVLIPKTVADELNHPATPDLVRRWVAHRPAWLQVGSAHRTARVRLLTGSGTRRT